MNDLPTIFFPYRDSERTGYSKMLSAEFIEACLEAKFSPLVDGDRADTEIFQNLRQLSITGENAAVVTGDNYVPRVLFLVEKVSIGEAGFLCVTKLSRLNCIRTISCHGAGTQEP